MRALGFVVLLTACGADFTSNRSNEVLDAGELGGGSSSSSGGSGNVAGSAGGSSSSSGGSVLTAGASAGGRSGGGTGTAGALTGTDGASSALWNDHGAVLCDVDSDCAAFCGSLKPVCTQGVGNCQCKQNQKCADLQVSGAGVRCPHGTVCVDSGSAESAYCTPTICDAAQLRCYVQGSGQCCTRQTLVGKTTTFGYCTTGACI